MRRPARKRVRVKPYKSDHDTTVWCATPNSHAVTKLAVQEIPVELKIQSRRDLLRPRADGLQGWGHLCSGCMSKCTYSERRADAQYHANGVGSTTDLSQTTTYSSNSDGSGPQTGGTLVGMTASIVLFNTGHTRTLSQIIATTKNTNT